MYILYVCSLQCIECVFPCVISDLCVIERDARNCAARLRVAAQLNVVHI